MNIELTGEQKELIKKLRKWYMFRSKPYYSYTGLAGTGKSTVIQAFIEELGLNKNNVAAAAYVGKAVLVLLRMGLNASTIHSLIYNTYTEFDKTKGDGRTKVKMKFVLKQSLDPNIKLIIIDEATMVNDDMAKKILSFGIPTIFVGDNNQLPPIFGSSSIMDKPDFSLTKIMRQAENDPIIHLSQLILNDKQLPLGTFGLSSVIMSHPIDRTLLDNYDIILCAKNATRETFNNNIRHDILHLPNENPIIGDKIICRQNNWDYCVDGIFMTNGLIGFVEDIDNSKIYKGYSIVDFRPDFMREPFREVALDYKYIRLDAADRADYGISNFNKFEYGYCISTHLSQGSGYDDVLFIDEFFWDKETTKKLRYTAITRAKKSIVIVKSLSKKMWTVG